MNFFYRNTLFLSDFPKQLRENKLTVETNNSKANSFLLEHLSCLSYVSFFCGKILSTELAQKLFFLILSKMKNIIMTSSSTMWSLTCVSLTFDFVTVLFYLWKQLKHLLPFVYQNLLSFPFATVGISGLVILTFE